jgi:integral membrane protein (TIGR00529 family)
MEREIVSLIFSIVLIVVLVRFKVDLGISMLAGAASLSFVVGKHLGWTFVELGRAAIAPDTLLLLARIVAIIALGALAGRLGYLDRFVEGLRRLISDNRIVIALMPAFGGLLPMPGGAMLTAPLVESATSKGDVTPEQKFFVNYWFRHVWEYIWPLYPGIVFAAALVGRPVGDLSVAHMPLTAAAIVGGVVFVLHSVRAGRNEHTAGERAKGLHDLLVGIWPFGVVIAGVLILKFELVLVVLVVMVLLIVFERVKGGDLLASLKSGARFEIITLVVGVAAYQHLLSAAGIVEAVPPFFLRLHMPVLLVLFAVPALVGLITGVTLAYIAVTFPLLLPFMGGPELDLKIVMFAYASGFVGVLLSPVHLCLVLSREYYRANIGRSFRMLVLPSVLIMAVATVIVLT